MANAIVSGEIDSGLLGTFFCNDSVDGFIRSIYEENRPRLGVERLNVPHTIILFVRPGKLMLFDDPLEIILATGHSNQTNLPMAAHNLPIKVKAWLPVLNE